MKIPTFLQREILLLLTLTAIQSLAQSTYEPYAFTTLAGGGGYSREQAGSAARFNQPFGVDSETNLFVTDTWNHAIRKVTPSGAVTTVAGLPGSFGSADGTRSDARFSPAQR